MNEVTEDTTAIAENDTDTIDPNLITNQELSLQSITFTITASNEKPTNSVTLKTEGLEISNEPQMIEIASGFIGAETEDLNSDGSPEVILFFTSNDSLPEEFAIGFSVNNLKSISRIFIPPLTDAQKSGYQGGVEMAVIETKLVRRFPLYEQQEENWVKTGKFRQLQYVLKDGEASRVFVLEKETEF